MTARFIVDHHPTLRVLDTANCYRIIKEYGRPSTARGGSGGTSKKDRAHAAALAQTLNVEDEAA